MTELYKEYTEFLLTWYGGFTSQNLKNVKEARRKLYGYIKFQKYPHVVGDGIIVVFGKKNTDLVRAYVTKLIKICDPDGKSEIACDGTDRLLPTRFLFKDPTAYFVGLATVTNANVPFTTDETMICLVDPSYESAYRIARIVRHKLNMPSDRMCVSPNGIVTAIVERF